MKKTVKKKIKAYACVWMGSIDGWHADRGIHENGIHTMAVFFSKKDALMWNSVVADGINKVLAVTITL